MNDMNDRPARDSNPQPLAYHANALPTELLGLAVFGLQMKEDRREQALLAEGGELQGDIESSPEGPPPPLLH